MRNLRSATCLALLAAFVLLLAAPEAGAHPVISACKRYAWMKNVPRGSELAAPNTLCVQRFDRGSYTSYRAIVVINPPHRIQLAARLVVTLVRNGRRIARSGEYVTPWAPVTLRTRLYKVPDGTYCARLWNHDVLGYYRVEGGCHRF
jgi:hypothetical protein